MFLKANDALQLAIAMPQYEGKTQLITVPVSLIMGWTNSPPTFCAASETATDMANTNINQPALPPHCMEKLASPHDAWADIMLHNGQSTINMLHHGKSAVNMPYNGQSTVNPLLHGQSAVNMLANGQSAINMLLHGQSTVNMPTNGQSAINMLLHGQSTINMPTNGQSTINMLLHGQSAINMPNNGRSAVNKLKDLVTPTPGNPVIPTWSTINTLRDLMIPTPGDPMIRALPACHLAPEAWPPLLLHSSLITHVDVFIDAFISIAQGSPALCQHVCCCILHAIDRVFA